MDARIAEYDNGQDAVYHKYGSFLTRSVDDEDDAASNYGAALHYRSRLPTQEISRNVFPLSYEPGAAQPPCDEAHYQERSSGQEKKVTPCWSTSVV
jgi:hypothetical protein